MKYLRQYVQRHNCDCTKIHTKYILGASIHRCLAKEMLQRVMQENTLGIGYSDGKKHTKKDKVKGKGNGQGRGPSYAKFNARLMVVINEYDGPVRDLLRIKPYAKILPRGRMVNLTIADVDRNGSMLFVTLPVPKKLTLAEQTLSRLSYQQKAKEIRDIFSSKGCGFVSSISVDTLSVPGLVSPDLAVDMCTCSEQDELGIPTKVRILCEIIEMSTRSFEDFRKIAGNLCASCFIYMMKQRPMWHTRVLENRTMKDLACDKVGNIFTLPPPDLSKWATICKEPAILHTSGCRGLRPSLMAYQSPPPSPADLSVCKDIFCTRLCSLTKEDLNAIRQALHNSQNGDLGCLAYLDGVDLQQSTAKPMVNGSFIPGSCPLRSRLLHRVRIERRQRQKRSCSVTCADIEDDISLGINPPDVIDVIQIQTCLDPQDFSNCTVENSLGDYQWNVEQAKALFNMLRERKSTRFLYGSDLKLLGFIGFGFTPEELGTVDGVNDEVYEAFGAAYGWSSEQLKALAQRYLRENNTQPYELDNVHLARMNHLVCGLSREQATGIPLNAIKDSTPILGAMQRCEIEVLEVLAQRLVIYNGPAKFWHEDDFSEYGIILAGLKGEDLRAVGNRLSDHVTVAIINHIPPVEFRKLSPEQTSMFDYDVSLAVSRRGLCAWLTDRQKQGYLEHHCSGASSALIFSLVLISTVLASTVTNCPVRLCVL